jgi:hypothetical protein
MSQQALLIAVVKALERAGIHYMLTGSLVSSLQGEPRSTHDIDFVVSLTHDAAPKLTSRLSRKGWHINEESAERAIKTRGMFNLIDAEQGIKVDFWMLTEEPFDLSRFARKRREVLLGHEIWISAPEDTILAKLNWAKLAGGSEKQFTDAMRVYELQYPKLDQHYIQTWVERLDITDLWKKLLAQAHPLQD